MFLVVGLGNPGPKYAATRHNVGFMVVERLRQHHGLAPFKEKFKGVYSRGALRGHEVVLLEPMTYMNLSGTSVQPAMQFFKVDLSGLIVIHDELDLPFGAVRLKWDGGLAGHKGLKSIAASCGGQAFGRVRVGIGRPQVGSVEQHVLSNFSSDEGTQLENVLGSAAAALEDALEFGFSAAMNRHNR